MAELPDIRHEQFCRLRVAGQTQAAAYEKSGFRGDRKNASKFDAKPAIRARIAEIEAEEALLNPEDIFGLTNAEKLQHILDKSIKAKNWPIAVQAGKALADGDGSMEALANKGSMAAMTDDELIAEVLPVFRNYELVRGLKPRPDGDIAATMRAMLRNSFDPEPAASEAA